MYSLDAQYEVSSPINPQEIDGQEKVMVFGKVETLSGQQILGGCIPLKEERKPGSALHVIMMKELVV